MKLKKSKSMLTCGCSCTAGSGFLLGKDEPKFWINQLATALNYELTNIAEVGRNNDWIFIETMLELSKHKYDAVVVAWSTLPRNNINLGLELWSTRTRLHAEYDVNTNEKTFKIKWQTALLDKLLEGYNFHWDFLKLVKYVNILKSQHKHIYFVNTFGPWSDNFFTKIDARLPDDLDEFTQDLLNVKTRDDIEIFQLYDMIHKQYDNAGGISSDRWLNLYDSFEKNELDKANDNSHPGYLSNNRYTEMLYPILKEKLEV